MHFVPLTREDWGMKAEESVLKIRVQERQVAASVELRTLDLSSGPDLRTMSSSPAVGSTLGVKPT